MSERSEMLENDLNPVFAAAAARVAQLGPEILNIRATGIMMADDAFSRIVRRLDLGRLASWEGKSEEEGNCFFASTHAAVMLLAGGMPAFDLVTGVFETGGDPVIHAWIELDARSEDGAIRRFALNVANLGFRPGYALPADIYRDLNRCSEIIVSFSGPQVRARARVGGLDVARHWSRGEKVRKLTLRLLSAPIARVPGQE